MKVKTFVANSVQEGMQLIKRELGPEAMIIHSRKVRQKGLLGFLTPPKVEITAAIDSNRNFSSDEAKVLPKQWENELGELKAMVAQLVSKQQKQELQADGIFSSYLQKLRARGIEEKVAEAILIEAKKQYEANGTLKEEVLDLIVQKKMKEFLPTDKLPPKAKIVVFTGPTGVGKTTTLAKLAAHLSLYQNKRVGMITIDTYRIGAVEQLRTYAEITDIPIEVVMTPKEIEQALEKLSGADIILVDTAGRSANNSLQVRELTTFINRLPQAVIFLVLSVTTKTEDLRLIVDKFRTTGYNRLIFTKLDETSSFGAIINTTYATGLPVTYITTGQNVPDDLEEADAEKLVQLILKG